MPSAGAFPLVRVEQMLAGGDGQASIVVSGLADPAALQRAWAAAGVASQRIGDRLRATSSPQALERAARRALPPHEADVLIESLHGVLRCWGNPPAVVPLPGGGVLAISERPLVMGIVNVTDDSFSDGGLLYPEEHPQRAVDAGRALLEQGADLLDIGGESTRPGSTGVPAAEERHRVLPVIERLAADGACCSVDTVKAEVAVDAIRAGAQVVNDVSGAREPAMLDAVAASGAAYVLMHTRGTPADMQSHTSYEDLVAEVYEFLAAGLRRCAAAGLAADRVLIDPGIGFAKTAEQNLTLLHALTQFTGLGRPVVVGASRKSFLGRLLGTPDAPAPPGERLEGSLACAALASAYGAAVMRVHDVLPTVRVVRVAAAIASADVRPT